VLRRDIFDRPPVFKWTKNNVILLGDSAHAMQPNLGQGGCMAIEDAYQLAKDLSKAKDSFKQPWFNMEKVLVVSQFPAPSWIVMLHLFARAAWQASTSRVCFSSLEEARAYLLMNGYSSK